MVGEAVGFRLTNHSSAFQPVSGTRKIWHRNVWHKDHFVVPVDWCQNRRLKLASVSSLLRDVAVQEIWVNAHETRESL